MATGASSSRSTEHGFTLLECEVAMILLGMLILGYMNVSVAHSRVLADVEGWLAGEPTYWVQRPVTRIERIVGMPATLTTDAPQSVESSTPPLVYDVKITNVETSLFPPTASCQVKLLE